VRRGLARHIPSGFETLQAGVGLAVVEASLSPAVLGAGLLEPGAVEERLARSHASEGRARTAIVELPGRSERLVLRPVRHGGWLGPVLGSALWGVRRPLRELAVTHALERAGVPVPHPALVLAQRRVGPIWSGAVGTLLVEEARDGVAFLDSLPSRSRLEGVARAAGRAVRRFHDAGGRHADLHVKNLLVRERPEGIEVFVIDLDRARLQAAVTPAQRMRELMRLYRSLRKRRLLEVVRLRGCTALFRGYVQGDRALRRALLARASRERLRVAVHAIRYSKA
jgi:3-deoxy-D-manno-octulosonic acid kinase